MGPIVAWGLREGAKKFGGALLTAFATTLTTTVAAETGKWAWKQLQSRAERSQDKETPDGP